MEKKWEGSEKVWDGLIRHIAPLSGFENANLIEIKPGYCLFSIKVQKEMLNLYGRMHGGAIFTLCDVASGMATYAYSVSNVTLQGNINYIKGIPVDSTIFVCCKTIHKGRQTAVNQVEIKNEKGTILASAQFTMFITGEVRE